jgi:hypothetical protein
MVIIALGLAIMWRGRKAKLEREREGERKKVTLLSVDAGDDDVGHLLAILIPGLAVLGAASPVVAVGPVQKQPRHHHLHTETART